MTRPRVLYLLRAHPQLSETYIATEMRALQPDYDVRAISFQKPDTPGESPVPSRRLKRDLWIRLAIARFRPDVLHTHWLTQVPRVHRIAARCGIPYTVRTHSFDIAPTADLAPVVPLLNDDHCRGVLSFPYARPVLEGAGVRPEKLRDCFPVVDYARFLDRSPNGDGVMNVGACLPKKGMEDFLALAAAVDAGPFRLYAIGYEDERIRARNRDLGSPVEIVSPLPHAAMPREFKRHRWLVYTACRKLRTVGWPCSIAEAQASGTGVCVSTFRPEMRDYVGDGAGYVYDSVAEIEDVVSKPPPDAVRERGFEQARRSDVREHLRVLTELWGSHSPLASGL